MQSMKNTIVVQCGGERYAVLTWDEGEDATCQVEITTTPPTNHLNMVTEIAENGCEVVRKGAVPRVVSAMFGEVERIVSQLFRLRPPRPLPDGVLTQEQPEPATATVAASPKPTTKDPDERDRLWMAGNRAAYRSLLLEALKGLDMFQDFNAVRVAQLALQLEQTKEQLRRVCEEFGDNDWENDDHLADVVEKHLARYLRDGGQR